MEDVPSPPDPNGKPSDSPDGSLLGPGAVAFLTLGAAVAVALVLGAGLGALVDAFAGTSPLFTLVGLAFGIVMATLMTINRVRKYL